MKIWSYLSLVNIARNFSRINLGTLRQEKVNGNIGLAVYFCLLLVVLSLAIPFVYSKSIPNPLSHVH
jgi:hypothetical protein